MLLSKRPSLSFEEMGDAGEDELSDDGSQAGEKKRRLNLEQVSHIIDFVTSFTYSKRSSTVSLRRYR